MAAQIAEEILEIYLKFGILQEYFFLVRDRSMFRCFGEFLPFLYIYDKKYVLKILIKFLCGILSDMLQESIN